MNSARRRILRTFAASVPMISAMSHAMIAQTAFAQSSPLQTGTNRYPTKPIRIVVGFAPGGTADTFARLLAQYASTRLGVAVTVDNRAGAAAIIGADHVAKSAADGYTFLLTFSEAMIANTVLYRNLPYKPRQDLAPVAMLAQGPLVIAVHQSVPAKNLRELVTHARANTNAVNWGSWGAGSHGHLLCEALNKSFGLSMLHVPFRGEAPTIQELIAGQIQIAAGSIGGTRPHLQSGALRAIGVIGRSRSAALADVPTLLEQGATDRAFQTLGWVGVVAPAKVEVPIVLQWSQLIREFLQDAAIKERFASFGWEPNYLAPDSFAKTWEMDLPVWTKLIRESGVTLD